MAAAEKMFKLHFAELNGGFPPDCRLPANGGRARASTFYRSRLTGFDQGLYGAVSHRHLAEEAWQFSQRTLAIHKIAGADHARFDKPKGAANRARRMMKTRDSVDARIVNAGGM